MSVGYTEKEIRKEKLKIHDNGENPKAPAPKEMVDLEVHAVAYGVNILNFSVCMQAWVGACTLAHVCICVCVCTHVCVCFAYVRDHVSVCVLAIFSV